LSLFLATAVVGQDAPRRAATAAPPSRQTSWVWLSTSTQTAPQGSHHLKAAPNYSTVFSPRVLIYPTRNDVPNFNAGFDGNGIPVAPNGTFPRNKYALGIQTNGMDGGGCVPLDPTKPFDGCVQLPDASGNLAPAWIEREHWTFRLSYIDPSNPSAAEVNIGFLGWGGVNDGDWTINYVQHTAGGHQCFITALNCDYYGIDLPYLTGTAAWSVPSCSMKLGPGYTVTILYQASPYKAGAVPNGAQEWYPDTTPATATRLAKPGGIIYSLPYSLGRADNALTIYGNGLVHPGIPATGYTGQHDPLNLDIGSISPGSETITVNAFDCVALPNVAFTISRQFIESGGHAHSANGAPPLDEISSLDSYSGTTDTNGHWTTTLHAGTIAETMKYTATSSNLEGSPFTAESLLVTTGLLGLVDPGVDDPNIRYTGYRDEHPSNHWASPELHAFVRELAAQYNTEIDDPDMQGSFGLNDMSLQLGGLFDWKGTWAPPHGQHSFGVACDIDHNVVRFTDGHYVPLDYQDTLRNVARDLGGFLIIESNNNDNLHVQIPESQISDVLLRETR
jgi:hypothetical protein